ncbi:hypothetical protein [Halobacteriovorax sp. CON-3]|uniref:hypothetical protein n=1 Tax=Halobacteriovorax sp. CON-3 TaxID=3157710 RepID=UPI0037124867
MNTLLDLDKEKIKTFIKEEINPRLLNEISFDVKELNKVLDSIRLVEGHPDYFEIILTEESSLSGELEKLIFPTELVSKTRIMSISEVKDSVMLLSNFMEGFGKDMTVTFKDRPYKNAKEVISHYNKEWHSNTLFRIKCNNGKAFHFSNISYKKIA